MKYNILLPEKADYLGPAAEYMWIKCPVCLWVVPLCKKGGKSKHSEFDCRQFVHPHCSACSSIIDPNQLHYYTVRDPSIISPNPTSVEEGRLLHRDP